ncbi:extracellular signal-regulated kinase 2 [Aricia agestis]|uniref:extracellular signal-regulated kinase 2 n=1 Tax=Aricia agestis TaxID=91739 RepID=UPI001C20AC4E|nr:extracellular signal-regulated kinase 2 [Aricia agestis]
MGSYLSINLEDQFKRNEKFLQSLNEIAMERQIQLKNQMAQRQRAMEIAKNRDIFLYSSTFFVAAAVGLFTGFRRTKRPYFLFPLLPLTFVNLYYYDLGYGNKMHRIRIICRRKIIAKMTTNPTNARKEEKKNVPIKTVKKSPEKNMSEIDEHILKRFDIKKRLGKGAYGIVWKAVDKKTKDVVAIKKIFDAFCNQTDAQRTFREIIFLQSFRNHPNIVKLHSIHRALNNRDIYLGFEYMETDLHNVIKRGNILKDIHKRYIMYQMLKATKYIHSGNVIHRDQKPSNVLIDSACRVKLADFGLARSVSSLYSGGEGGADPCLTDYVATRWYRAPEILIASKNYTKGIDMWSLGCILGEMLTGKPLFPGSSTVNQIERIMSVLPRPSSEDIAAVCSGYGSSLIKEQASNSNASLSTLLSTSSRDAADLVKQLLVFNPTKRLSAEQALNHEYVSKFHREKDEVTLASDVLLPLRDDKQLSVDDYRNKLYSIMAKGFQNTNGLTRKSYSGKSHTLISTTKASKSFQEMTESTYTTSKHMSASAGVKTRTKTPIERPLKEYRSDQAIKPVKATKSFETRSQEWLNNSHRDYFPSGPSRDVYNSGKKLLQQRRNSTSFSTLGIGDAVGFGQNQKHGVITASALMDLRTSIR